MPTARELLEQADALMRRNRKRGRGRDGGPPTLTDALDIDPAGTLPPTLILPEAPVGEADPIALDTLSDLPVLTDVVDVWPPTGEPHRAQARTAALDDALDDALEADVVPATDALPDETVDAQYTAATPMMTGTEVAAVEPIPPTPPEEEFILELPPVTETQPPVESQVAAPAAAAAIRPPTHEPGSPEWDALAEEIRMQVLQRLDLFTDTGMREQLGARLQPIVSRASAELVETINHALGELVRGYVAEAIEREIESWHKRSS